MNRQQEASRERRLQPARSALGARMGAICAARGWSTAELARQIGMSERTLCRVRRGKQPGGRLLEVMLAALEEA